MTSGDAPSKMLALEMDIHAGACEQAQLASHPEEAWAELQAGVAAGQMLAENADVRMTAIKKEAEAAQ